MKRIFVLLLAVIMIMSLAACDGGQTPDKPDDSGVSSAETNSDESSPEISEAEASTPVKTGAWVTKTDIEPPDFGTPQKVTDEVRFETSDALTMNLYKAHWSDINPEELKKELQALPLLEGWTWHVEKEEKGCGKLYSDVGQQRNFESSVSLIAEKETNGRSEARVSVIFSTETNKYVGWNSIRVYYSVFGEDKMEAVHQEAMLPILQTVYGDAAEYMLYAPVTERNAMELKLTNEFGSETVQRTVEEYQICCSLYAYSKLENAFKQYSGDYAPMLANNEPEYYRDVFGDFGALNFNQIEKVGAEFFQEHLPEYARTTPGTYDKMYTYKVADYDNGDKDVEFSLDMLVYQKDAATIEGMEFTLQYLVEIRDGVMNVRRAKVHAPALCEDWDDNDPESAAVIKKLNQNLNYAKMVANAVFGTDFNLEEVYWGGGSDYKLWQSYSTELFGRQATIRFDFSTKTLDSIGKNRVSFTVELN